MAGLLRGEVAALKLSLAEDVEKIEMVEPSESVRERIPPAGDFCTSLLISQDITSTEKSPAPGACTGVRNRWSKTIRKSFV